MYKSKNICINSMKRRIQADKDSSNKIIIKNKNDINNKIKMNFKNFKVNVEKNYDYLKNFSTYLDYFQSKTLKFSTVFSNNYIIY